MAADWYLINHSKKELYELGKGKWSSLTFINSTKLNINKFGDKLLESLLVITSTWENVNHNKYVLYMRDTINRFINDDFENCELLSDCSEGEQLAKLRKEYKQTYTRYDVTDKVNLHFLQWY